MPHFSLAFDAIYFAALGWCLMTAPWRALAAPTRQHGWMGLTVALLLVWSMRAPLDGGVELHLAGASLAALMFGARLATLSLAVVLAVLAFTGRIAPEGLALQGIAYALLPALLTVAIQRLVEARLPRSVFVYIFVAGFAGTLLANLLATLAFAGMAWLADAAPRGALSADYLSYRLLLCWGESMLTGMLAAIFVAYRPQWMMTFRDEIYLARH
ncbi:MAG: energy-coupling factor ABC transporter permease [Burkholderiales bacterium]